MNEETHNHYPEHAFQRICICKHLGDSIIGETELVSTGKDSAEALENMKQLIKLSKEVRT